jgi:hypothetical protein
VHLDRKVALLQELFGVSDTQAELKIQNRTRMEVEEWCLLGCYLVALVGISSQRASVASYSECCSSFTDSCHPDGRGAKFLRNVGSYKSHKA